MPKKKPVNCSHRILNDYSTLMFDHLPSSYRLWRQVAGTDDLQSVHSIKLRVIGREMSLQRLCVYLPNLVELNLDGSSVGSLRELGCGLSGLRVLRVTRCGLDSLDGTFGLSSLTELYAAYNRVQDIGYLACLPNIEHIDLRGNVVTDIRYAGFLTVCAFLKELVLAENPCAQKRDYRATIREMLPALDSLDGVTLCNYQQDDETDTPTEAGEEDEDEEDAEGANEATTEDAVAEEGGKEETQGDREDESGGSETETEQSASTSSASSRSGAVDAARLWARARETKHNDQASTSARPRPLLRPATASCGSPRRPNRRPLWGGERPVSAVHNTEYSARSHEGVLAADADAPSPLTSGGIVCGNLSLALRRTRRRREAWGQPPSPQQPHQGSSSSGSCSSLSSSLSNGERSEHNPIDNMDAPTPVADASAAERAAGRDCDKRTQDCDALLAASRRWRDAYHQYRSKLKWEELDCESGKPEEGAETASRF